MSISPSFSSLRRLSLALAVCLSLFVARPVHAENIKVEALLIWGTNAADSPDPKHKPVDAELKKKFHIFKWKNYFVVRHRIVDIKSRSTERIRLSDKCEIDVTELEKDPVEVKLYGEGKLINRTVKSLRRGEVLTIAGEDKNDSAWFVVVKRAED